MAEKGDVGVRVSAILGLVSDRLYSNAGAFLRENVQNSIDALRLLQLDNRRPDSNSRVEIRASKKRIEIEDWGIGMSSSDVKEYYLTIGSSSKNNPEALACKVIGKFGIGAFANFGVCYALELQSWKKNNPKVRVRLLKEKLVSGDVSYSILDDAVIGHLGTLVVGETNSDFDEGKLKKLLQAHVQYLPERVVFNGELISGKTFPSLSEFSEVAGGQIELLFGPARVLVHLRLKDGEPYFSIAPAENSRKVNKAEGFLAPKSGSLQVFLNRFMIDANFSALWRKTLTFDGVINTDFLQPNAAREGMEAESATILADFLEKLSRFAVESMARADLLFQQTALIRFVSDYSQEYMPLFRVRRYGKKDLIRLDDILKAHGKTGVRVIINKTEQVPAHVASLAQGIILIQLDNVGPDVQRAIIKYLKEKTDATLLSEFELKATPLVESEISASMKSLRLAIRRALSSQYALEEFEVVLCKADESHTIVLQEISGKPVFMVNVKSHIFKLLLDHVGDNLIEMLVVRFLIAPHLGDILVKFIPGDIAAAIARFKPKPYVINLQKVGTIELIKGSGWWDGPGEDCIEVVSAVFRSLEGYYVKLPDRIGEVLRHYIASCEPPMFIWFGNKAVSLLQAGESRLISLEMRLEELIVGNGNIQGTVREKRRCLIYRTGVFLPIPNPHLRDLLPIEKQKEISFGFDTYGFSVDEAGLL